MPDNMDAIVNRYREFLRTHNYSAAIVEAQKLETAFKAVLGTDHTAYADALGVLAGAYSAQGDFGKAEEPLKRELAIRERALGTSHPEVVKSLNFLASVYRAQGKFADAEEVLKRVRTVEPQDMVHSAPTNIAPNDLPAPKRLSRGRMLIILAIILGFAAVFAIGIGTGMR